MKIEYVHGNLLDSSEPVIAHGCNAQGVMKSGVAAAIREKYPQAYWDYFRAHQGTGLELGDIITTSYPNRTILNIISQENYGRDPSVIYVSYDALARAMMRINGLGYTRVAFPMIGAGLGNGKWSVIASIIESYSNFSPVVYHLEPLEQEQDAGTP
jgi:O-acetyl-ADP-ribose deacetylase (regulator of RNase III)